MENKVKHTYAELATANIDYQMVLNLNSLDDLTKQRMLFNARKRILKEIDQLENEFFNYTIKKAFTDDDTVKKQIPYHKQMELVHELQEYGFVTEVKECMEMMEFRIVELHPELIEWFAEQKISVGLVKNMPSIGKKIMAKVVIIKYKWNADYTMVSWCCKGNELTKVNECAVMNHHLALYMMQHGYSFLTDKTLSQEVLNAEFNKYSGEILANYISAGWELLKL
jgi:hypothetical protein